MIKFILSRCVRSSLALLILAFFLGSPAHAYLPSSAHDRDIIEDILALTGQEGNMGAIHQLMLLSLEKYNTDGQQKPEYLDAKARAQEIFSERNLYEALIKNLRASTTVSELKKAKQILHLPIVSKMIQLELAEVATAREDALNFYKAYLKKNPADSQKEYLIRQWVKHSPHSEHTINIQMLVELIAARSLKPAFFVNVANMKNHKNERINQQQEFLYFKYLYTYRNVDHSDLSRYLELMTTNDGQQFYDSLMGAHLRSVHQLGTQLVENVKKHREARYLRLSSKD